MALNTIKLNILKHSEIHSLTDIMIMKNMKIQLYMIIYDYEKNKIK